MLYNQTKGSASNWSSMCLTIKKCKESQSFNVFENSDGALVQEFCLSMLLHRKEKRKLEYQCFHRAKYRKIRKWKRLPLTPHQILLLFDETCFHKAFRPACHSLPEAFSDLLATTSPPYKWIMDSWNAHDTSTSEYEYDRKERFVLTCC